MKKNLIISLKIALLTGIANPARAATTTDSFGGGAFTMDFVTIGNPGNAADTTGAPNPVGAVVNTFRMGTYEVSRDMITKANGAGNLGITLEDMASFGGNGVNKPATGVSWNEAAHFVNWLNTSSGSVAAYKFSLQPGDVGYSANTNIELWNPGDDGYDATNLYRNSNAKYFLPSENEWYKAAFYSGEASNYFNYPTGSDTKPTGVTGGTDPDTAVYSQFSILPGPADITSAGGLSPYGTMGQGGNVFEWTENSYDWMNDNSASARTYRGGSWNVLISISASYRSSDSPAFEAPGIGFRVASNDFSAVPEPRTMLLGLALLTSGLLRRIRS